MSLTIEQVTFALEFGQMGFARPRHISNNPQVLA